MSEDEVLRQNPFQSTIGKIKSISSLVSKIAMSGETFKITSNNGKQYKLRYCNKLRNARRIERNVKLLPHAFPKFYGREGRYLLFDWIDGDHLGFNISPETCYKIGKLMGEAHALEDIDSKKNIKDEFKKRMRIILSAKIFSKEELIKIELKYKQLRKKVKIDFFLEFNDVHPFNLMLDKKGNLVFVDEDGFGHKIKGYGLTKPLLLSNWIGSAEKREAFFKGYNEHHSDNYFDLDYQRFLAFMKLLNTIYMKIETNRDYTKEKKIILQMIK